MSWSLEELTRIAVTDDLHVAPYRADGVTYGTPIWIWSVVIDGAVYARAYSGRESRWYQAALRQQAGRITAAGMTREVRFDAVEGPLTDAIDDAYRAKYRGNPFVRAMTGERARAATVRIMPRAPKS